MKLPIDSKKRQQAAAKRDADTAHAEIVRIDTPIEAALRAVNGRAKSFALTYASEIRAVADEAENALEASGIPKAERAGARLAYRPAGPSARAYKYAAASTVIEIERSSSGIWHLTSVRDCVVYPRQARTFVLHISETQRDAVIKHALSQYSVAA